MMWLDVGSTNVKVTRASEEEAAWLNEFLSFSDPTSRFRNRDGRVTKIHLFNRWNNTFPAGLLPLVKKGANEAQHKVELFDSRAQVCTADPTADLAWLRDYQRAAVDAVVKKERGILWMTTGAGKTEVAIALTRALPCRWLFLVHRSNLMDQAAGRYELRTGLPAGRVGEGAFDVPNDTAFISTTFQSLQAGLKSGDARMRRLLDEAEGLIIDESHTLPADTFYATAMACQARYRVGLSGTPLARGDRKSLFAVAAIGPVIYRVAPEVLIKAGVLARPKIHLVRSAEMSDKPTWQGVYGEAVVRSNKRNGIVVAAAKLAAKPCLVFVKEIKHGRGLVKMLEKSGMTADFVYGNESLDARKRAVKDLVSGRIEVLVCSVVFQEGQDIPELRSVVNASGGKSVIASLQRIGRGMRVSDGKTEFDVYDIADMGCGCTTKKQREHTGCRWLDRHTRERLKAYVAEGHQTAFMDIVANAATGEPEPATPLLGWKRASAG